MMCYSSPSSYQSSEVICSQYLYLCVRFQDRYFGFNLCLISTRKIPRSVISLKRLRYSVIWRHVSLNISWGFSRLSLPDDIWQFQICIFALTPSKFVHFGKVAMRTLYVLLLQRLEGKIFRHTKHFSSWRRWVCPGFVNFYICLHFALIHRSRTGLDVFWKS